MAALTSTQSGPASDPATWGGATPSNGDTFTVAAGHTVDIDAGFAVIPGSNSSSVGPGITVDGTLTHSPGVTLTLRGNDSPGTYTGDNNCSNPAMLIASTGTWTPGASTVQVDCASDYQTVILNKGTIVADGTTFTVPAANISWSTQVTNEVNPTIASGWWWDIASSLGVASLANPWISNAAGTGAGSFGDSSLVINSSGTSMNLATEVALPADLADLPSVIDGPGKYAVDYDAGYIYFWVANTGGTPSGTRALNTSYKHLTLGKGYGIDASQSTASAASFRNCTLRYGGATTATPEKFFLNVANRTNPGGARPFVFTNNDVRYCGRFLNLIASNGTSGDPIAIEDNHFGTCFQDIYGSVISCWRTAVTYLSIIDNTIRSRNQFFQATCPYSVASSYAGFVATGNTGLAPNFLVGSDLGTLFEDGLVANNTLYGVNSGADARCIQGMGGSPGHPLVIEGNSFRGMGRTLHTASDLTFRKNLVVNSYHHPIAGNVSDNIKVSNVTIEDNLIAHRGDVGPGNGPSIQLGYNHKFWGDNFVIANNTLYGNANGAVDFGETSDLGCYNLLTNVQYNNNLMSANGYGYVRPVDAATVRSRLHLPLCDHNLSHGNTVDPTLNFNRGGSFTHAGGNYNTSATRNVTGVALFDPSTAFAGTLALRLTVNAADSDVTLEFSSDNGSTWGAPAQLIFATNGTGTATAGGTDSQGSSGILTGGTLTNSGAAWGTAGNAAASPRLNWLKTTGGTGSGQVRAITDNTATGLTVVPKWTTTPVAASTTYAIYQSEVKLFDAGGVDYVRVGIVLASLPTTSQTDTGITYTLNDVSGAPNLSAPGTASAADYKITAGSAAIGAGTATNAPTTDYFGASFANPPSIGFAEFVAAATIYARRGRSPRVGSRGVA